MGGPINKVATLFAQTQVDTQPWLMGGVGIAICTPPLGMALRLSYSKTSSLNKSKKQCKAAAIMGSIGISEGVPVRSERPNARTSFNRCRWYRGLCIRFMDRRSTARTVGRPNHGTRYLATFQCTSSVLRQVHRQQRLSLVSETCSGWNRRRHVLKRQYKLKFL